MECAKHSWYQNKLNAIFALFVSLFGVYFAYDYWGEAKVHIPKPQQVLVDMEHRPVGVQNLLSHGNYNRAYRKDELGAADFAKEGLLTLFTYNKTDLESGKLHARFDHWLSSDEMETIYEDLFLRHSVQKIVKAQDGLVRARILGDLTYVGEAERDYETSGGLEVKAKTYKFTGKIMITVHGNEDEYPTLYSVSILIQRALLQDKIKGFQIVELGLS
jgi:hypothetical protein